MLKELLLIVVFTWLWGLLSSCHPHHRLTDLSDNLGLLLFSPFVNNLLKNLITNVFSANLHQSWIISLLLLLLFGLKIKDIFVFFLQAMLFFIFF
jgi:hypothetical protein